MPQAPQFWLVVMSVQVPLQLLLPLGHWQPLLTHEPPVGQALPQLPQFCALLLKSTQDVPQVAREPQSTTQAPAEHILPLPQTLPQLPQFAPSLPRSTHTPLHAV